MVKLVSSAHYQKRKSRFLFDVGSYFEYITYFVGGATWTEKRFSWDWLWQDFKERVDSPKLAYGLATAVMFLFDIGLAPFSLALAVAYDTSGNSTTTNGTSVTFNLTVAAGSDKYMISASANDNTATPDLPTFNADGLSLINDDVGNGFFNQYQLINPDSGAGLAYLQAGFPANTDIWAVAYVFTGVHQTVPLGTRSFTNSAVTGTAASVSQTNNNGSADGMFVDFLDVALSAPTADAGQSNTRITALAGASIRGAGSTEPGATSATMGWSWSGNRDYGHAIYPILPAGGAVVVTTPTRTILGVGT